MSADNMLFLSSQLAVQCPRNQRGSQTVRVRRAAQSVERRGYGLDDRRSIPEGAEITLFNTECRPVLRPTQPVIRWVMRPGREADHSLLVSAEVKIAWSYTSTPSSVTVTVTVA
jgi:hypothetical protein